MVHWIQVDPTLKGLKFGISEQKDGDGCLAGKLIPASLLLLLLFHVPGSWLFPSPFTLPSRSATKQAATNLAKLPCLPWANIASSSLFRFVVVHDHPCATLPAYLPTLFITSAFPIFRFVIEALPFLRLAPLEVNSTPTFQARPCTNSGPRLVLCMFCCNFISYFFEL